MLLAVLARSSAVGFRRPPRACTAGKILLLGLICLLLAGCGLAAAAEPLAIAETLAADALPLTEPASSPTAAPHEPAAGPTSASASDAADANTAALTASAAPAASPTPVSTPAPSLTLPSGGEQLILVRISEQRVYAYAGQELVFSFPVSTGRNQNTAVGRFSVRNKIPSALNVQWGYRMPHWMGVYWVGSQLQNGFHALPLLEDGSRLWADQIGTPASDGCIVLLPEDMAQLYEWAEVGTPVVIEE